MDNFLIYKNAAGDIRVEVLIQDDTVWMSQKAIANLFGIGVPGISKHLRNIFESGELDENSVVSILETTALDGKKYKTRFFNLDAIISVGYRVNSLQATHFRIWATKTLKEFMIKGFSLDDERLKQGKTLFGKDYFEELVERIRHIRASERRFYQKVTDLFALAADYEPHSEGAKNFFATVQNKLHWAITGKTAAEIIYSEADANKAFMGLKSWKGAPKAAILKADVAIAKNYLSEEHLSELERIVSAYLDLAENLAKRQQLMRMSDWVKFMDGFLQLSNYPILADKGKVSALQARLKAESEYEKFRVAQDRTLESDFDLFVKNLRLS